MTFCTLSHRRMPVWPAVVVALDTREANVP